MTDPDGLDRMIRQVRFTPVRRDAYDMGDVDRLLDELGAVARRGGAFAQLAGGARLRTVRGRYGYSRQEVDEFLARLAAGVDLPTTSPSPALLADDARVRRMENVRFSLRTLREGYEMHDVDMLLDRMIEAVGAGAPLRPLVEGAQLRRTRLRQGYDVAEVDAFLEAESASPA